MHDRRKSMDAIRRDKESPDIDTDIEYNDEELEEGVVPESNRGCRLESFIGKRKNRHGEKKGKRTRKIGGLWRRARRSVQGVRRNSVEINFRHSTHKRPNSSTVSQARYSSQEKQTALINLGVKRSRGLSLSPARE